MGDDVEIIRERISLKWVRGDSGTSYLCPVKAYDRLTNKDEDSLKMICVDESDNPHND